MYKVVFDNSFKKDLRLMIKRGYNTTLLDEVILRLSNGEELPKKYKDHALTGNYEGYRECHIRPDWLLIYQYINDELILHCVRTGSHSDLF
jgi:mRNA interferase YafQ